MAQTYKKLKEILPNDLAREIIKYNMPKSAHIVDICQSGFIEMIPYGNGNKLMHMMHYYAYGWNIEEFVTTIELLYPDLYGSERLGWYILGAVHSGNIKKSLELLDKFKTKVSQSFVLEVMEIAIKRNYIAIIKELFTYDIIFVFHRNEILVLLLYYDRLDMYKLFIEICDNDNCEPYGVIKKLIEMKLIKENETIRYAFEYRVFELSAVEKCVIAMYSNDRKTLLENYICLDEIMELYWILSNVVKSPHETDMVCCIMDVADPGEIYILFDYISRYKKTPIHVDVLIKYITKQVESYGYDGDLNIPTCIEITGDIMKFECFMTGDSNVKIGVFIKFLKTNISHEHLNNKKFMNMMIDNSPKYSLNLNGIYKQYREYCVDCY